MGCTSWRRKNVAGGKKTESRRILSKDRMNQAIEVKSSLFIATLNYILETVVSGEIEKDSFIALAGKGGNSGLMPSKWCVPT